MTTKRKTLKLAKFERTIVVGTAIVTLIGAQLLAERDKNMVNAGNQPAQTTVQTKTKSTAQQTTMRPITRSRSSS